MVQGKALTFLTPLLVHIFILLDSVQPVVLFFMQPLQCFSLNHFLSWLCECCVELGRWRRLSTRVKSAAESWRLSRINSVNYPGNVEHMSDSVTLLKAVKQERFWWMVLFGTSPPSGCWSCTWNATASTHSCLWTANWASKWSSPGTWPCSPTAPISPGRQLVWAWALKLPRKTTSSIPDSN